MDENEFELGGNSYISKVVDAGYGCDGCGVWTKSYGCAANLFPMGRIPSCEPDARSDHRKVIFVEKHP